MAKKKIGIVGHFGGDRNFLDGQTVKTKNVFLALSENYPPEEIQTLDTYGYRKNPFSFLWRTVKMIFKCRNIIVLPDENGVKVFIPLYSVLNIFLRRKLHYCVIGGWLPEFFQKHKLLRRFAKRFTGIYVETRSMKISLEKQGFKNADVIPNFKYLDIVQKEELIIPQEEPYKLCTFSRVMKEKGIEDAVNAVKTINESFGRTVYALDIYGQVDPNQTDWFENLKANFPEYVKYGGLVPFEKSVDVLKEYFSLLFPTYYESEGFAGTLIDAFSAGVPVIASDWRYNAEIINESVGFVYPTRDQAAFIAILKAIALDPNTLLSKKLSCLNEAKKYQPQEVIRVLMQRIS